MLFPPSLALSFSIAIASITLSIGGLDLGLLFLSAERSKYWESVGPESVRLECSQISITLTGLTVFGRSKHLSKLWLAFFFSPFFKNACIPRRLGLPLAPVTTVFTGTIWRWRRRAFFFWLLYSPRSTHFRGFFFSSSSGIPHSRKGNVEEENLLTHS